VKAVLLANDGESWFGEAGRMTIDEGAG